MGLWDNLTAKVDEWQKEIEEQLDLFNNNDFPPAIMAAVALVAFADGAVTPEERKATGTFITRHPLLKKFDALKMRDQFYSFCTELERDDDILKIGDEACVKEIIKIKGIDDQSRALVQMMISVAGSDGYFDAKEKSVVRRICVMLGIDPIEFEL
ncbi:tellurite resistance TerB family protein [Magnetococcales bacterium HHB-1]